MVNKTHTANFENGVKFMINKVFSIIISFVVLSLMASCTQNKETEESSPFSTLFKEGIVWVHEGDEAFPIDVNGNIVGKKLSNLILGSDFHKENQIYQAYIQDSSTMNFGIIDINGNYIFEPIYSKPLVYGDGLYSACLNDKFGYLDVEGEEIIPFEFDSASAFSEGLACVSINGKYGFINKNNQFVIEPIYDYAYPFNNLNIAAVNIGDRWGFINKSGAIVIPIQYNILPGLPTWGDLVVLEVEGKIGLMNLDGTWAVKPTYSFGIFSNHEVDSRYIRRKAAWNDKYGFWDITTNQKKIDFMFDDAATNFSEDGLAAVCLNGKWGYIDLQGDYYIEPMYDTQFILNADYSAVCLNGKYGFIDQTTKLVITPQFDNARSTFHQGVVAVELNGKWGYIDYNGNIVIDYQFDNAGNFFDDGYAVIELNDLYGVINKKGEFIIEPKYNQIGFYYINR